MTEGDYHADDVRSGKYSDADRFGQAAIFGVATRDERANQRQQPHCGGEATDNAGSGSNRRSAQLSHLTDGGVGMLVRR